MAYFKHNIKLYLQQKAAASKPTPIRCYVLYDNRQVVIASGEVIEPKNWDDAKKTPKRKAGYTDGPEIAKNLKNVIDCIDTAFEYLTKIHQEYPDGDTLKQLVIQVIKNDGVIPGQEKKTNDLLVYIQQIINDTKNGKRVKQKGERYKPGTVRHYNSVLGVLKRFAEHKGVSSFKFNDINLNFYFDLKDFCYQIENLTDNYFGTVIKFLKTCMNESKEEGIHNNDQHNSKRFAKVSVEVENVYLTAEQLDIIFKHDLTENPRLDRARDLFLVGCWTGLRFSDFTNIKAKNIKDDFLEIKTQKTEETVAIPIHPTLQSIMNKYVGITANSLPPAISNDKLNEYIKDAIKDVKFKDVISLEKSRAGIKFVETKKIHEWVSTHTARRSFASNMFRLGVPSLVIMAITGHRTEKAFLNYIKVTPKEKAEIMREIWQRQAMTIVKSEASVSA